MEWQPVILLLYNIGDASYPTTAKNILPDGC